VFLLDLLFLVPKRYQKRLSHQKSAGLSYEFLEENLHHQLPWWTQGRPADTVMHHYWVKEAGDPEAIGEYFPEERGDGVPIYRSRCGVHHSVPLLMA